MSRSCDPPRDAGSGRLARNPSTSAACRTFREKSAPASEALLRRLTARGVVIGLVTGNLSRIGWRKMERAGLRPYFRFGAFAEMARDRAGLVRIAIRRARQERWIGRESDITLIGDHPNDVLAAQANGIRAVAVGTGIVPLEELQAHSPLIAIPDLQIAHIEMTFVTECFISCVGQSGDVRWHSARSRCCSQSDSAQSSDYSGARAVRELESLLSGHLHRPASRNVQLSL